MVKSTKQVFKWIAVGVGLFAIAYLVLLIPRYITHRKGDITLSLDLPPLAAYAYPNSNVVGDSIQLFVTAEQAYTGKVFRIEEDGFLSVHNFSGGAIEQSNNYHLKHGHDWTVTHSIPTESWGPGFYLVRLQSLADPENGYSVPVLLRKPTGDKILVVAPTNTWQAYNQYGGKSNYQDTATPPDLRALFELLEKSSPGLVPYNYLPVKRPMQHPLSVTAVDDGLFSLNGKVSSDLHLIKFMEGLGLEYGVISDGELARLAVDDPPQLIIFNNHSEYWSYEGIGRLKDLLRNGTSVMFLSGNNMYREVETVDYGSLLVTEQAIPRQAVEPLLGTAYSVSGYLTLGSFRVTHANSWVFDSTGLVNGDTFGEGLISGIETDKLGPYSEGFTLLAIGTNTAGPAHMVIKEFSGGNFLFNASSVSSVRALPRDAVWRQILTNLINRAVE